MSVLIQPASRRPSVESRAFKAFGSTVTLTAVDVDDSEFESCFHHAHEFAETWEQHFSRFRPDSELSRLNRAGQAGAEVSPLFLNVLDEAMRAKSRTGGRFDPTMLQDIVALGYNRDFDALRAADPGGKTVPAAPRTTSVIEPDIDRHSKIVTLRDGQGLDFGGIAKGIFIDRLFERFHWWPGGSLNAGGDLRVWGEPPHGAHWVVGIEDPFDFGSDRCRVRVLTSGASAVATSALNRRVWTAGGQRLHHLIDPATGRPVAGRVISATAIASDLKTAEIATKALLVSSSRGEPLDPIDAATALVIDELDNAARIGGCNDGACQIYSIDSKTNAA